MQIVIEIPEEYRKIFETEKCKSKFDSLASNEFGYVLRKAFENGTLLPKNHGRLIDADKLIRDTIKNPVHAPYIHIIDMKEAPTIIEGSEKHTCTNCLLDGTDACSRGAGRAVDDRVCEDFI